MTTVSDSDPSPRLMIRQFLGRVVQGKWLILVFSQSRLVRAKNKVFLSHPRVINFLFSGISGQLTLFDHYLDSIDL